MHFISKTFLQLSIIVLIFLSGCEKKNPSIESNSNRSNETKLDTTVFEEVRYSEPNDYRRGGYVYTYHVVSRSDTSRFRVSIFNRELNKGLQLHTGFPGYDNGKIYSHAMKELKKILQHANRTQALDSISLISLGSLINTGDLAIDVSKDFDVLYPEYGKLLNQRKGYRFDYEALRTFLMTSELTQDFNTVLSPYSLKIKNVFIEKAHYTAPQSLPSRQYLETDSSEIPENILNGMVWLEVGAIQDR